MRSAEQPEGALLLVFKTVLTGVPPMPKCSTGEMQFGRIGRRIVEADFAGGALSSDGGLMLLREVDRRVGL